MGKRGRDLVMVFFFLLVWNRTVSGHRIIDRQEKLNHIGTETAESALS